jgi:hypothetical protein
VIQEHEAKITLQAVGEKIKAQEQSLALTHKVLLKRESASSAVIFLMVANAMALVKNHMPKFDT